MNFYTTKKKVLVLIISGCLSFKAVGSAFPVVDLAGLVQAVTQYSQLIQEYEQILKQTGLNTDQLLTTIDQYTQTLREYQVLLNQVESLKNKLDRKDYMAISRDMNRLYENHLLDTEVPQTLELSRRQADFGTRDDMNTLATDALSYVPQDLSYSYNLANNANTESKEREYYRELNKQSRADIDHLDEQRLSLGSQSELATLQLIVEQNQILIDQIAISNEMRLASMGASNLANQSAEVELRAKQRQLERIKRTQAQGIVIDERPFR